MLGHLFADPRSQLRSYLGVNERVLHVDMPSMRAFVVESIRALLLTLVLLAVCLWWYANGGDIRLAVVLFLAVDLLLVYLVVRRLEQHYTLYVITTARIMRVSGVFTRQASSIPWAKVTDLTFKQSLLGRWLGYATLRIESANEDSGLKDLSSLRDPIRFNRLLVEMLVAKQGSVRPTWVDAQDDNWTLRVPDDRPLPSHPRRRGERRRHAVPDSVIDD